jgi:hypothetical protein
MADKHDEFEVLMKKCEWITAQTNQLPDRFITITVSFFIPILIALSVAIKAWETCQFLFFIIPWLIAIFLSIAAYLLYVYRGLNISMRHFEDRIDELTKCDMFLYARRFGQNYFDRFTARDPIKNQRILTPLLPLVIYAIVLISGIDAISIVGILQCDSGLFGWSYSILIILALWLLPVYLVMSVKGRFVSFPENLAADIKSTLENKKGAIRDNIT